jgi:hypothetical protein
LGLTAILGSTVLMLAALLKLFGFLFDSTVGSNMPPFTTVKADDVVVVAF